MAFNDLFNPSLGPTDVKCKISPTGEGRVKWTPRLKWVPYVTPFLIWYAVKATVVVFTDPPGDTIQRRICLFGAKAKR